MQKMVYSLMIFTQKFSKEILLPTAKNTDYKFVLDKEEFGFRESIEILMENIDDEWRFQSNGSYSIQTKDRKSIGEAIANSDVFNVRTRNGEEFAIIVVAQKSHFIIYDKFDLSRTQEILIGKDGGANQIIYDFFGLVSRTHAKLQRGRDNNFYLYDLSVNGVYVNGKRIQDNICLQLGDCINILGLKLLYLGEVLGVCATLPYRVPTGGLFPYKTPENTLIDYGKRSALIKNYFHRSPRTIIKDESEQFQIEEVPENNQTKKKPLLMTIGPSFTMVIPMLMGGTMMATNSSRRGISAFTGMITTVCSAIIGITWALVNLKYSNDEEKKETEDRFGAYSKYLIDITARIKKKYEESEKILNVSYPSADKCTEYGEDSAELWNRNSSHEDLLFVRLGIGDVPFQSEIICPEKSFKMTQDELGDKPEEIKRTFSTLHNVPIGVDLQKERLLGIVGGERKKGAYDVARTMVTQIIATTCYTDVKIAVVFKDDEQGKDHPWRFAKWLPHIWAEDKKSRYYATNKEEASDVFYEIANICRMRLEEKKSKGEEDDTKKKKIVKPQIILFVSDAELLEGEPILKYIVDASDECGLSTVFLAERYEDLPNQCDKIIFNDEELKGIFDTENGDHKDVIFDQVVPEKLEAFSRRLSNMEVKVEEGSGEIPNTLEFFEMHGVSSLKEFQVIERWKKNRTYESMKALIGKKSDTAECYLDIHEKYHGPHGLIAGTTGSGKSETLQTYMLSLAINYSPYDVGFFIIDFKGGGMANLFTDLPHTIGQISNLSGNQVRRAMVSIKSENKRRQRIFSEYGVNNINLYTRLVKNNEASIPIPHLFIIIDEFAELKREEPEFMKELISVAQVGRSLGVHLILATQKPSGTVDDNIWSNTKFRLCLRVADKSDSNDMLHKPDAAYITQAGRCYLQVGNDEIFELFQSGWSGATYDESELGAQETLAVMLTKNGKAAIVGSKNKIKKQEKAKLKWIASIVNIIKNVSENCVISVENVKKDSLEEERLIDEVFIAMKEVGMDYPDTTKNRSLISNMIQLWPEEEEDLNLISSAIIQASLANKKALPERKEKTQLDAIVEYLAQVAKDNSYDYDIQLWMPLLPTKMYLSRFDEYNEKKYDENTGWKAQDSWSLETVVGLYDDPENQAQNSVMVSFSENGHNAVVGGVESGKSTLLQTIIWGMISQYSPDYVNFYIMDFSSQMLGAFEGCAHVGAVMFESDLDRIGKCFNMILQMLEERKKLFRGGNYSQYVQVNGVVVPAIVVVIDNMANFREKTGDKYLDLLISLSRDAASYGIYFLISAMGVGGSEIPTKMDANIRGKISLDLGADKYKYGEVFGVFRTDVLPEIGIKGRGLAMIDGTMLEYQAAMSLEAEDDYSRTTRLKELCSQMSERWDGEWAKVVPEIPEEPVLEEFVKLADYRRIIKSRKALPIGYNQEDASIASVDLARTFCYMISGRKKSGKTNFIKILMEDMSRIEGAKVTVFDAPNGRLKRISNQYNYRFITEDEDVFNYWEEMIPEFVRRNKLKKQYRQEDLEEEEIIEKMMEEPPIFIIIGNVATFLNSVYNPKEGIGNMSKFIENMTEKGANHNIYLFVVADNDMVNEVTVKSAFMNMKKEKQGIHMGGNTSAQKIFRFTNISYKDEGKNTPPGIGLVPSALDEGISEQVVIPLVK